MSMQLLAHHEGQLLLLGGRTAYSKHAGEVFNDMWAFDLATRVWRRVEPGGRPQDQTGSATSSSTSSTRGAVVEHPSVSATAHAVIAGCWWVVDNTNHADVHCFSIADGYWREVLHLPGEATASSSNSSSSSSSSSSDSPQEASKILRSLSVAEIEGYSVRELKEAIASRGGSAAGCVEKGELRALLRTLAAAAAAAGDCDGDGGDGAVAPAGVGSDTSAADISAGNVSGLSAAAVRITTTPSATSSVGESADGVVRIYGTKMVINNSDCTGWQDGNALYIWGREDDTALERTREAGRQLLWSLLIDSEGRSARWQVKVVVEWSQV